MEHTVSSYPIALLPRAGEVLNFLGATATIKSPGWVEIDSPHGFGSPLHVHHDEDEWFYVLEGEMTIWVDGETFVAPAGSFAYGPRGLPHTFEVTGAEGARFIMVASPTFTEFIRAASGENPPPPEALTEIAAGHAIEILGPPGIPA
jgi:mannose-6-phosphate isomerase-like protein (cupin superfamily)